MWGDLFCNGKSVRSIHLSVDPEGRNVHLCRYDMLRDSFDDVLFLKEYQLFVPGDGGLEFSGFHPLAENRFESLRVEFIPSRADFLHDCWSEKRNGRDGTNGGSIGG